MNIFVIMDIFFKTLHGTCTSKDMCMHGDILEPNMGNSRRTYHGYFFEIVHW